MSRTVKRPVWARDKMGWGRISRSPMPGDALNPVLSGPGGTAATATLSRGGYDATLNDEAEDLIGRRHVGRRVHRLDRDAG